MNLETEVALKDRIKALEDLTRKMAKMLLGHKTSIRELKAVAREMQEALDA